MKNWSHTVEKFNKKTAEHEIWRLEQLINFGLDGEKIPISLLRKYISRLNVESDKKNYLLFLLKSQ